MASQDELIVKIGADFDDLKKDLKRATDTIDKMGDESKKTGRVMAMSFAKATIAVEGLKAAAMGAAKAMSRVTIDVVANARQQELWANRLQISKESFSSLAAVGARFGAEMDDVGDAIKDLNERIADAASGNKTYEEQFRKIGLRSRDLIKLPVEEQFIKVSDAIGKMNNAGAQNFAVADLMADAGFRLLEVFRLGEDGIRGMRKELEDTNVALSEADFETLGALAKEFRASAESVKALSNQIAVLAAGPLTEVLKKTQSWTESLMNAIGGSETAKSLQVYNELMKLAAENTKKTADASKDMAEGPMPFGTGAGTDLVGEAELGLLEEYLQQQSDIRRSARDAEILDTQFFNDQLYEQERAQAERMSMLWESGLKGRMQVAKSFFGSMSVLMQTENRKMFEVGKAAAIANAVITTIESAQKSFNAMSGIPVVGPALGAAAAAAAVAGGMARVQQIQSTTMGGGGGGLGGAAGGGVSAPSGGAEAEVVNQTNVDVSLQGSTFSQDQVRGLIGEINEAADDNFVVRAG